MNLYTFLIVLAILAFSSLAIGLYASRKIHSQNDYYLSVRRLTVLPLMFTLIATQIGGGVILGTADEAFHAGLFALAYILGISLGFTVLASGFASRLRGFNIVTTAQLFETHYHSKFLRKIASLLIVISMTGILVGQVVASRKFIYGLGIDADWILIIFWLFIISYTVIGGLKAVVLTDIYQVLFIIILFTILFIFISASHPLNEINWIPSDTNSIPWSTYLPPLMLPLLFCIVEQDLAQRCFAAKSKKIATIATALSAIILLLFGFIPIYFGLLAQHLGLSVPSNMSVFVVLLQTLTNPIVTVIVATALLAAIISTADSLLCAISSNLAQDFEFNLSQKGAVNLSRLITLLMGLLALVIGYHFDNIIAILVQSNEIPVSALFVSILFCCITKRIHKTAAMSSVIVGGLSFIAFKFISTPIPKEVFEVLLSLLAYIGGWLWAEYRTNSQPIKKEFPASG